MVIAAEEGVPIFVRDVAEVRVAPMPRHGAVTHGGKGESVAGMVIMLKGENAKQVSERVKGRIAEISETLPQGISLRPFYDQTEVIDRTTRTLRTNLLEGSLLVILVLFFSCGMCGRHCWWRWSFRYPCSRGSLACACSVSPLT
jgi:cobalt-zinc-cadmium resistance protein CzcA